MKKQKRFDALRFKVYKRFCKRCPEIFSTKHPNACICPKCSRSSKNELRRI